VHHASVRINLLFACLFLRNTKHPKSITIYGITDLWGLGGSPPRARQEGAPAPYFGGGEFKKKGRGVAPSPGGVCVSPARTRGKKKKSNAQQKNFPFVR